MTEDIIARYYAMINDLLKEQLAYFDVLFKVKKLLKKEKITPEELKIIINSIEYLETAKQTFKESNFRWHK